VRRAKDLLCADLSANLGLAELAGACRLSVSRFSQAFRQTVGCPPHQWLMMQRVERAKELILNTDQSLSEIALAIGFADQSHFTRVFSQRVEVSPAAWRRAQER
jgi:AraC-like DNA-binding protein